MVASFYGAGSKKGTGDAYRGQQPSGGSGPPSPAASFDAAEAVIDDSTAAALKRIANFSFWCAVLGVHNSKLPSPQPVSDWVCHRPALADETV